MVTRTSASPFAADTCLASLDVGLAFGPIENLVTSERRALLQRPAVRNNDQISYAVLRSIATGFAKNIRNLRAHERRFRYALVTFAADQLLTNSPNRSRADRKSTRLNSSHPSIS